jgi:hypothetical protein
MSLQSDDALDAALDEILEMAAERALSFQDAARAHWFGYRPADGRTINPLILDDTKTSLEIARELRASVQETVARLAA